jgi:hypothetical protein
MLLARLGERQDLRHLVVQHGNFESALGRVRQLAAQGGTHRQDLGVLEAAVADVFRALNQPFAQPGRLNQWSNSAADSLDEFLAKFDAIYSVNQDMLLECWYSNGPYAHNRWPGGWYQPGIVFPAGWREGPPAGRIEMVLTPGEFQVANGSQPIYKLHGSTNWRTAGGDGVMIVGEGKEDAIGGVPLLRRYFEWFARDLEAGGTRVMAIGYSFSDPHVDELMERAQQKAGLQLYLVNPAGLEALRYLKPENIGNKMRDLAGCVHGYCTRPLPQIFGGVGQWRSELENFLVD